MLTLRISRFHPILVVSNFLKPPKEACGCCNARTQGDWLSPCRVGCGACWTQNRIQTTHSQLRQLMWFELGSGQRATAVSGSLHQTFATTCSLQMSWFVIAQLPRRRCLEKGNESSDTQICVEGVSDDDNNSVDSDAAYPSDSTQEGLPFHDY